jgi:hypothetical protein
MTIPRTALNRAKAIATKNIAIEIQIEAPTLLSNEVSPPKKMSSVNTKPMPPRTIARSRLILSKDIIAITF